MLHHPDSLWLYHLTLRLPSNSFDSIVGNFSGDKKVQELVLASNTTLEVYRLNTDTGKLDRFLCQRAFALIQRIDKIRLVGTTKDLLVVTADSGILTVLQLEPTSMRFVPIVQEPHSKNALRRLTPGEYLCVEPRGRAILVGAIERDGLAYKVQMDDSKGSLALSSPLTVSTKGILTLSLCSLDTGFENPMWAAIEIDHLAYENRSYDAASTPLQLAYYEFDQGLNHVVRRKSKHPIPSSASSLVAMPGHVGGLVICCGTYLIYEDGPVNSNRLYVPLPIREDSEESTIVCSLLHTLKKTDFFLLLQTSLGDLIKVTVDYDNEKDMIRSISATYFDTIPICNSINVFKAGYLFANCSDRNKVMYQFELLGEDNETTQTSVALKDKLPETTKYQPKTLRHLARIDEIESLGPLTDSMLVETLSKESLDPLKRLVTTSSKSSLKTLDYGLSVSELVSSPLPINPTDIYTAKLLQGAINDQYLVLSSSLSQKTMVLSIGEVVEEVRDSGLEIDQHTLMVQQIGTNSLVQIHTNGIRNIHHTFDEELNVTGRKVTDWFPPAGIQVLQASCNSEQVVVGLSNREIVYFEIDKADDQLLEYQERFEVSEGSITAIAIATSLLNERRSSFLVVGVSDESIQVLSLQPHNCLEVLTLQALSSNCRSLLLLPVDKDTLYVHIGMDNGIYVRVSIDPISGKLSDSRLKYLGTKPVQLRSLSLPNMESAAILAFSSRPWLGYFNFDKNLKLFPLLNSKISSGASFYSEDIGVESVVGIYNDNMSIFTIGKEDGGGLDYSSDFVTSEVKLRYTPRRLLKSAKKNIYYVLQAEPNIKSPFKNSETADEEQFETFGYPRHANSWASCIQVVDHNQEEILQTYEFLDNKYAVCMAFAKFGSGVHLVVSATQCDSNKSYSMFTFKVDSDHKLQLLYETKTDGPVTALEEFEDKLVAVVGNSIRIYEKGMKHLLRKSSTTIECLSRVNKIEHLESGLFIVADASSSVIYVSYDATTNHFVPIISDTVSRAVTAFTTLDTRTVVAGDKFGNIFVNRVPQEAASQISNNVLTQFQDEYLNGPNYRLSKLCDFYIADVPTSFHKGSFVVGGTESLVYTGIQGTIGIMLPVGTYQEVEFLSNLEKSIRKFYERELDDIEKSSQRINLVGREHLKFRGYYNPVKNVIDGDLLEKYFELDSGTKIKIASELGRVPREVERKLYDLRNRAAF